MSHGSSEGETALEVLSKHSKVETPELVQVNPDIPDDLSRIVSNCLIKDSDRRYQNMDDLLVALESSSTEISVEDRIYEKKMTRLRLLPALTLGGVVILIGGLVGWIY